MAAEIVIDNDALEAIRKALSAGNSVELKLVKGRLVIVEIKRTVKIK